MAKTEHYYTQFENDGIYHIYNRSVDRKLMFRSDENYRFFIRQFDKFLSDYLRIYAYSLLGNHFHFMVKINDLSHLTTSEEATDLSTFEKLTNVNNPQDLTTFEKLSHLNEKLPNLNYPQDLTTFEKLSNLNEKLPNLNYSQDLTTFEKLSNLNEKLPNLNYPQNLTTFEKLSNLNEKLPNLNYPQDLTTFEKLSNLNEKLPNLNYPQDLTTFEKLSNLNEKLPNLNAKTAKTTHEIVSHQFKKFFQSYAMAFNKQHNRIGTLFQTPFKRVRVDDENYLRELACYINTNAEKHKLVRDFKDWKWSSYHNLISNKDSKLLKIELIEYFQDVENFIFYHHEFAKKSTPERDFFIEDE
jgi:hypothetical protein